MKAGKSISTQTSQSIKLVLVIISLYCLWCTGQKYWRNPPQPAVGEEADLGVLVFLSIYFFLPHSLCIMSMNPKEYLNTTGLLPLWWFHSNQLYNYLFSSCCRRKLCWVRPGLLTIVKLPLYGFKLLYLTDQWNRTYIQCLCKCSTFELCCQDIQMRLDSISTRVSMSCLAYLNAMFIISMCCRPSAVAGGWWIFQIHIGD